MAALTLARAYQHSFDTHPNSTLAITGGCLNALGDVIAQVAQNIVLVGREENDDRFRYDPIRTFRFFCFGFAMSPMMGRWNAFLEYRFPLRSMHGSGKVSFKALSKRVACDQLVLAPIGLGAFIGSMGVMEARSVHQIRERFSDLYKPVLITNWKVWPLAQLINFRYLPLPYRVPFSQTCGLFWTLYLSILNSNEGMVQDENALRKPNKA